MASVGRNVKRRSRIRPIARQHPFDVNVCTRMHIDVGDALFCSNTAVKHEEDLGTFTKVFAKRSDKNPEQLIMNLVGKPATEDTIRTQMQDGDNTKIFVGFAVTDAALNPTDLNGPGQIDHLPMTIAGAVTVTRDTFMHLLMMSIAETKPQSTHVATELRKRSNIGSGYRTLPAGFEFVLHGKVLKLIDTVHLLEQATDRSQVFQSVSMIVSTLSS